VRNGLCHIFEYGCAYEGNGNFKGGVFLLAKGVRIHLLTADRAGSTNEYVRHRKDAIDSRSTARRNRGVPGGCMGGRPGKSHLD